MAEIESNFSEQVAELNEQLGEFISQDVQDSLPSEMSLEEKVALMAHLKAQQVSLQEEYDRLRDEVTPELEQAQFFIDADTGQKRVAYRVAPERTEVDASLLESYVGEDVLDEVTERKVKTPVFWQAVKAGRIPEEVAIKVARLVPQTPHVRFGDPNDLAKFNAPS